MSNPNPTTAAVCNKCDEVESKASFVKKQTRNSSTQNTPFDEPIFRSLEGNLPTLVSGIEQKENDQTVPEGWKIKQVNDDQVDERKTTGTLLKTKIETQGNVDPPLEGDESVPEGWKIIDQGKNKRPEHLTDENKSTL